LNDSSCSCHLHGAAAAPAACKRPLRTRRDVLVIALFLLTCCCLGSVWKVSQNRLHSKQVAAAAAAATSAEAAAAAAAAAVKPR
jgi:predicted FMN-binding regulatory protein PaiB